MVDVGQSASHEALDRDDGVARIFRLGSSGVVANLALAAFKVAHDGGQQHPACIVGQTLGNAIAHRSHQRVRGAQVNTDGNAPLVRVGGLAGFGNLQQRHGFFLVWVERRSLLSQQVLAALYVLGKTRNEHEGSDLLGSGGVVVLLVDQRGTAL